MGLTANELLQRITSRELTEYEVMDRLEPFTPGEMVIQQQLAMIVTILANVYRDRDIHPGEYEISEFMPQYHDDKPKRQTWQEQYEIMRMIPATYPEET